MQMELQVVAKTYLVASVVAKLIQARFTNFLDLTEIFLTLDSLTLSGSYLANILARNEQSVYYLYRNMVNKLLM